MPAGLFKIKRSLSSNKIFNLIFLGIIFSEILFSSSSEINWLDLILLEEIFTISLST